MSVPEMFILTLLFTFLAVYRVWIYAVKIENFSVIDVAWSAGFFVQALLFLSFSDGYQPRKILLFLMLSAWSLRLAYFLFKRIRSHHPKEDTRYARLRKQYGAAYESRFLRFFMMQAFSISVLTLPFIYVMSNPSPELTPFEMAGLLVFAVSWAGESLADWQMHRFKADPKNKGLVCDAGLWKYSRHPNYFFESCIWFGFFIFALGTPGLWWAVYAPLTILFLLLKVTGVPPSEAQAIESRGDRYREYQSKTSVFIPMSPKGNRK
jgi:steroid 5-alpha reductase family enzyme